VTYWHGTLQRTTLAVSKSTYLVVIVKSLHLRLDPHKDRLEFVKSLKEITGLGMTVGGDNFRMNTGMVDMVPLIIWLL
jgi:hypothetical protein